MPTHNAFTEAITSISGGGTPERGKSAITPTRRQELANLALSCCALFDEAGVMPWEKCYVGRLCQALLEF